jgi:parallel beta-helix repeat protein
MNRRGTTLAILAASVIWATAGGAVADAGGGRTVIEVYPGPNAINEALDIAQPGDILNIHVGVYPEEVDITVDGVTLQAAGDGPVTIDGTCSVTVTVDVRAEDVTLRGLRVVGASGSVPIEIDFSLVSSGRVADSIVRDTCGFALYGINVFAGGSIRIVGNTAVGFEDAGVYVGGISSTPHGPMVIRDNEVIRNKYGILVEDSAGGTILVGENDVHDNRTTGIWLHDADGTRVGGNLVLDNGPEGIEADSDSTGNLIRSNTVLGHNLDLIDGNGQNCWVDNTYETSQGDIDC